jgi:hypothetical protein
VSPFFCSSILAVLHHPPTTPPSARTGSSRDWKTKAWRVEVGGRDGAGLFSFSSFAFCVM